MDSEQGHRAEESSASSVPPPMPLPEGGYTCDSCGRDITLHCFIRCAECRVTKDQEAVDICLECFATGREPLGHQKTHAYRVMDKLQEKIFHENWTAAEELSLIEQVRKHGLGAWETLAESKMFFRRKTASDLCKHYLDTYLCRYGSILPPFYLHHRPDGTVERVPIPATGPEPHDARLKDLQVNSQEVRARTIAELGTDPQFRYESSWEALTKKQAAKNARDAAMKAAEAVEIAAAAAARANTANANVDAAPDESNLGDTCTASPRDGYPWDNRAVASIPALVTMSIPGVGDNNQSISGGDRSDAADGRRAKCLDRRAIAEAAVKAGEAAKAAAAMAAAAAAAAAEAGVDIGEFNSAADEEAGSGAGGSSSGIRIVQARGRRLKQQQNMKNKEEERAIKEWVRTLPGGDIDGYAPLRGDFEVEHDNKAEELLVNMEFSKTDHPSERQLKLDVVAVYNHRLDERERRKRFVLEHNLLDYKKDPVTPKRRRKEDQGLVSRLRPFARFHSVEEHDELIDNLLLAKKMRVRIAQLRKYQELGISTLAEAHEYEMAKRKQEELASKKHREASSSSSSSSYLYGGHAISRYNAEERCKRYDNRNEAQGVRFVPLPAMLSPQHERIKHANGPTGAARGGSDLMDLSDAPGVEYLAPAEQRICSELHLLPGYYLVVKDAMIQECARTGCLKRENIYGLAVMDTGRLDKMFDFFKTCGWIYDVPHPEAVPDGAGKSISA